MFFYIACTPNSNLVKNIKVASFNSANGQAEIASYTADVKSLLPNYANLTSDNFVVIVTTFRASGNFGNEAGAKAIINPSITYNKTTGKVTANGLYKNGGNGVYAVVDAGYILYTG